jgi:UDP-glucuronate 4-epimerase
MSVLVTGAAGFIGFHLTQRLLERGTPVLGLDNLNPYYDPALKRARVAQLESLAARCGVPFALLQGDLEDRDAVAAAFRGEGP